MKNEKDDNKLHLIIGEDIPNDAPKEFSKVALYIRDKEKNLNLYTEVSLPYLINHSEFLDYEGDPRYLFMEDYDSKNKKVTLDNLSDIKARINDGISYDEFKKAVGGVDGTLIEVSSWNKYVWVAEDGSSNVTASFGKDGNLKFFNGLGFKN